MFTINLNKESAAVLLCCLTYGQDAILQDAGWAEAQFVVKENVEMLRRQLERELSHEILKDEVSK